jgi:hypothetical protein
LTLEDMGLISSRIVFVALQCSVFCFSEWK